MKVVNSVNLKNVALSHDDYFYLDDQKEDEEIYETAGDYNGN